MAATVVRSRPKPSVEHAPPTAAAAHWGGSACFDARIRVAIEPLADHPLSGLSPDERALIPRAVPKRVREFVAGRRLAHQLLREVGHPTASILRDDRGAPLWPAGVVGSLSHSGRWVGAAVTAAPEIIGVGLDIDDAAPLEPGLWPTILTPTDQVHLMEHDQDERGLVAKLVFMAKEAAYKAQYASTRTFLPFSAMAVWVAPERDRFVATLQRAVGSFKEGAQFGGWLTCWNDTVVAAVTLDTR